MNPLTEIFGSRTRVRIIGVLARVPEGLTRNAVSVELGSSTTRVYEQMEQLRVLGVLREVEGRYSLDPVFPFHDQLVEMVLAADGYYDDPTALLGQIDALFGDAYFLTGFSAATANLTPVDYELQSMRFGILGGDERAIRALAILGAASVYDIAGFPVDAIPGDVMRTEVCQADVWCAGMERAVVDCLTSGECSTYGAYLIFSQYVLEGSPDLDGLAAAAEQMDALDLVGTLLKRIDGTVLPAPYRVVDISSDELNKALNTMGGG